MKETIKSPLNDTIVTFDTIDHQFVIEIYPNHNTPLRQTITLNNSASKQFLQEMANALNRIAAKLG
jgi:hypothetical protein